MLKKLFPHMYDSPEARQAVGGLCFGAVPFVVLPFTLVLMVLDSPDVGPRVVLECIYMAINFIFLLSIFRSYLADSWLNVTVYPGRFFSACLIAAAGILCFYGAVIYAALAGLIERGNLAALGMLPMPGIELMLLPGDFALVGGVVGTAFLILLGPFITALLYYATAFAPLCVAGHRIGCYLAVAVLTAIPRIITYFTIWGGWKEWDVYLFQLPIHLLACWTYQKTDTVWAPIFTHIIVNTASCAILWGLQFLGYIA